MPASRGSASTTSETAAPCPGSMLMTPAGRPAACRISIVTEAESCWVIDGFQMTTLPISTGAVARLPPMAVKLNGVTA